MKQKLKLEQGKHWMKRSLTPHKRTRSNTHTHTEYYAYVDTHK